MIAITVPPHLLILRIISETILNGKLAVSAWYMEQVSKKYIFGKKHDSFKVWDFLSVSSSEWPNRTPPEKNIAWNVKVNGFCLKKISTVVVKFPLSGPK